MRKGMYNASIHYKDSKGVDPYIALAVSIGLTWVKDYRMAFRRYLKIPCIENADKLRIEEECLRSKRFSIFSGDANVDRIIAEIKREEIEKAKKDKGKKEEREKELQELKKHIKNWG